MNENGKAALVMANSASDAGKSEYEIRKKMIEDGIIAQMVTLPSNMFASVTLPATLWFFDKQKANTDNPESLSTKRLIQHNWKQPLHFNGVGAVLCLNTLSWLRIG